jgi:hypothetical protein
MNTKCFLFILLLSIGIQLLSDESKQYSIKYENKNLLISYPSTWNLGDDLLSSTKARIGESIAKLDKDGILMAYVILLSETERLTITINSEKEILTKDKLQTNLQNLAKHMESSNVKFEDIKTAIGSGLYFSGEATMYKTFKKTKPDAKEYKYNTWGMIYVSELNAKLTFILLHDQENPEKTLNIIKNIELTPRQDRCI